MQAIVKPILYSSSSSYSSSSCSVAFAVVGRNPKSLFSVDCRPPKAKSRLVRRRETSTKLSSTTTWKMPWRSSTPSSSNSSPTDQRIDSIAARCKPMRAFFQDSNNSLEKYSWEFPRSYIVNSKVTYLFTIYFHSLPNVYFLHGVYATSSAFRFFQSFIDSSQVLDVIFIYSFPPYSYRK